MPGIKPVLVDSDALVGLVNENDALHSRCLSVSSYLAKKSLATIVLAPTILEAATALSRGCKRPGLARKLIADYSQLDLPPIPPNIFSQLSQIYKAGTSAHNTPFDYFLLSYARINEIVTIFSFDQFYSKHGLVLAEKLLK